MNVDTITIRSAKSSELDAVNRVIEAAVMTWDLPERVKRLALPSYRYQAHDLEHLDLSVAVRNNEIVGVLACEPAETRDAPPGKRAMLLHGIYVHPSVQQRGIGSRLLETAKNMARAKRYDGLLVKAQAGAERFFERHSMRRLGVEDTKRDYEGRYWISVA
jgi:predicted N-acetyltransferase YhbS